MRIFKLYDKLEDEGRSITVTILKDAYLGKKKPDKMLLELFQEYNNQVDQLIGQDFAAGTAERYRTAKKHVEAYNELPRHRAYEVVHFTDFRTSVKAKINVYRSSATATAVLLYNPIPKILNYTYPEYF